jgi:hypothetical protein
MPKKRTKVNPNSTRCENFVDYPEIVDYILRLITKLRDEFR